MAVSPLAIPVSVSVLLDCQAFLPHTLHWLPCNAALRVHTSACRICVQSALCNVQWSLLLFAFAATSRCCALPVICQVSASAWMSLIMSAFLGFLALTVVLATFYVMRSWSVWLGRTRGRRMPADLGGLGGYGGMGQVGGCCSCFCAKLQCIQHLLGGSPAVSYVIVLEGASPLSFEVVCSVWRNSPCVHRPLGGSLAGYLAGFSAPS